MQILLQNPQNSFVKIKTKAVHYETAWLLGYWLTNVASAFVLKTLIQYNYILNKFVRW